jgi:two-component system, NtrC family, response regulator HydG
VSKGPASVSSPAEPAGARRPWLLLIDEDPQASAALSATLEGQYEVVAASNLEGALLALEQHPCDVVVCASGSCLGDGGDWPELLAARCGDASVVTSSHRLSAAAQRFGHLATELPAGPLGSSAVKAAVERAVSERKGRFDAEAWRRAFGRDTRGSLFIGDTPSMRAVFAAAEQVARTNAPVFITGESGTGKEFLARYVHLKSPRRDRPFFAVNCAAFTDSMMVSEVFGHVRGAFTGAQSDHKGCIEQADHSTLLFDEIAELKSELQSRLLRVVESGVVTRLGSEHSLPIDVRFIAAAQRPAEELIRSGRLREDLYYRLGVVTLSLPPLRERTRDIEVMAHFLLAHYQRELRKRLGPLSPEALAALKSYAWPGNVREFANVIERAAIFAREDEPIAPGLLPPEVRGGSHAEAFVVEAGSTLTLEEVLQRYTRYVLEQCGGNRTRAARLLGVAPSTLWRWGKDPGPP